MGLSSYQIYLPVLLLLNSCFPLEEIMFFVVRGFCASSENGCLVPLISLISSISFHPGTLALPKLQQILSLSVKIDLSNAFLFLLQIQLSRVLPHQAYRSLLQLSVSQPYMKRLVRGLSLLQCSVFSCLGGRQTSPLPLLTILVRTSVMRSQFFMLPSVHLAVIAVLLFQTQPLGCCALLMCLMIKLWMQLISSAGLCSPPMTHRRQTPALWLYVGHVRDILLSRIVGGCVSLCVSVYVCQLIGLYNLQLVYVSAAILHIQVKWPILLLHVFHDFSANN